MESKIGKYTILIDEEDAHLLKGCYVSVTVQKSGKQYYRITRETWKDRKPHRTSLARSILGLEKGDKRIADHIDGNTLDNRRSNLRICNSMENSRNRRVNKDRTTSKYKGVFFDSFEQKWAADISINGRSKRIGHFPSEIKAARAYDSWAKFIFGEFAVTNLTREYIKKK